MQKEIGDKKKNVGVKLFGGQILWVHKISGVEKHLGQTLLGVTHFVVQKSPQK